ncbi:MAG: cysteine desulfurase NifS [Verrucomicrobia bacterium]|nr:MAG: cysteine desulfurase NifS [Verrucomicrobiota bacterium]
MIYLDYNATTPLCETARSAMLPFLEGKFGNPSSIHAAGREARAAIDDARDRLADLLGAKPHELIFTSGGTEANNLAILGLARSRTARGKHLISAKTEHHAVLNTIEHLEKREGFEVTWLNVSQAGQIDLDQLGDTIRNDTVLVSIMRANNETGVIQPLREISEICRERGVLLHSDMVQSFGKLAPVILSEVEGSRRETFTATSTGSLGCARDDLGSLVDAASFAAHKFYGPKGAGLLFLRGGIPIEPVHFGGAHENQRRPGTENVAAIAGMSAAAEFVERDREKEQAREGNLRDQLWQEISAQISPVVLNGDVHRRLANTLNISLPALDSETMLMALDLEGVCASSGSACMVGSVVASHVLLAMGMPLALARSAIRFSLGKYTTEEEISATAGIVSEIVQRTNAKRSEKTIPV